MKDKAIDVDMLRRLVTRVCGIYVKGFIDDVELVFTVDSGASATLVSKNAFDQWALKQERQPYFWAGIKFFNVYGPNEYHKQRMASVIFHAFNQILLHISELMRILRAAESFWKARLKSRINIFLKKLQTLLSIFHL